MTNLTEKPTEKAETMPVTGESKPMAERPRHPLPSLRDELDRLFESAFSDAVPTAG